jgi:hypothetical protein
LDECFSDKSAAILTKMATGIGEVVGFHRGFRDWCFVADSQEAREAKSAHRTAFLARKLLATDFTDEHRLFRGLVGLLSVNQPAFICVEKLLRICGSNRVTKLVNQFGGFLAA